MSGWTPPPPGPDGWPAGDAAGGEGGDRPGEEDGSGTQTSPGYRSPGYGYAPPEPYGAHPPHSRARARFGMIAGLAVLVLVIAGASAYILNNSKKWVLTAPQTAAGMSRDDNSVDQLSFSGAVAKFKSDVTSLPHYGHLKSTVSAIYTRGSGQAVGFVGFNGTFNVEVVLKSAAGLRVTNVNAGPHGGTAECGASSAYTICQWSTSTTVGIMVILPAGTGTGPAESVTAAGDLMVRLRDSVEQPAHGS